MAYETFNIATVQIGDIIRIDPDNEGRIEQIRGDPVEVLEINDRATLIKGMLLGQNHWGERKHIAWFGASEFDIVLRGQRREPSWEV